MPRLRTEASPLIGGKKGFNFGGGVALPVRNLASQFVDLTASWKNRSIAPILSARSDSFLVRSYGERTDATGKAITPLACLAALLTTARA